MDELAISESAWEDAVDPPMRDRARDYLRAFQSTASTPAPYLPLEDDDTRVDIQRRLKDIPADDSNTIGAIGCVIFVLFVATIAMALRGPTNLTYATGTAWLAATIGWLVYITKSPSKSFNAQREILTELFPLALQQVALNRTERAYASAVRELLSEGLISPDLRIEQIDKLNTLLASGRRLEAVRHEIAAALNEANPEALQQEREAIQYRMERTTDEATKDALTRSLSLCQERLERNKALEVLLERLDAEGELVYQAFGATKSALASLRISPTASGLRDPIGTITQASEVAETITRQTKAVEAAVQELGIRSG